jgi:hypothetical protein
LKGFRALWAIATSATVSAKKNEKQKMAYTSVWEQKSERERYVRVAAIAIVLNVGIRNIYVAGRHGEISMLQHS